MMKYRLYEVGGKVRDDLLGLKSKDIDYSVVVEGIGEDRSVELIFEWLKFKLQEDGFEIFVAHEDTFTIRAKFPKDHKHKGDADFVLARKEVSYIPGTRTPVCVIGTLEDDLERRDFTVNALARDEYGCIIDCFEGMRDLHLKSIDTPGEASKSFRDDPLRIIRAMRFCVTKGFTLSRDVRHAIREQGIHGLEVVSHERIREELEKCFKYDTIKTLDYLSYMEEELRFPLKTYIFKDTGIRLMPTSKS